MKDSKGRMMCAARVGDTILKKETIKIVRHIFQARIDHARTLSVAIAYKAALSVFNYALENNLECLYQWDDQPTKEDLEKSQEN